MKLKIKEAKAQKNKENEDELNIRLKEILSQRNSTKKKYRILSRLQSTIETKKERRIFEDNAAWTNELIETEEICGVYRASYWDTYTAKDSRKWVKNFVENLRV